MRDKRTLDLQRTLELEIEALREQRELLKLLKTDTASSQKEVEKREKARDRLIQSALEYWKAHYDFQKHLMTGGLAGAAAFIALLGGFFKGPDPWSISNPLADILIVAIIFCFFVAVLPSTMAARAARHMLWSVRKIETEAEDAYQTADQQTAESFRWWNKASLIVLASGFFLLVVFIGSVFICSPKCSTLHKLFQGSTDQPQGEVTVRLYVSSDPDSKISVQEISP